MTATRKPSFNGNHVGAPDRFKASYSPSVKAIDVPCPDCSAPAGSTCLMTDGSFRPTHPARRRMAVRKVNTERQVNPADFIWTLEHYQRQQLRIDAGFTLDTASKIFGVSLSTFNKIERGDRQVRDALAVAYGAWLRLRSEVAA